VARATWPNTLKGSASAPGEHTIVLAIADAGDSILDSGVFIQAGTFSDEPHPIPDTGSSFALLSLALAGLIGIRRARRD
jgi:hypothetical protein